MASVAELREEREEDPILLPLRATVGGIPGNNRSDIYLWKKFFNLAAPNLLCICGRQTEWREQRKSILLLFQGSRIFLPMNIS